MTAKVLWEVVRGGGGAGWDRETRSARPEALCAKLRHVSGGELDQTRFLLAAAVQARGEEAAGIEAQEAGK